MSTQRLLTSLTFQLREYRARLLPLVMVALLPVAFWAATYFSISPDTLPISVEQIKTSVGNVIGPISLTSISERDTWPMDTMFMGVGWGVSAAALYSVIGSGQRDRRLVLAGFRPWELLAARFAILFLIAIPISVLPVILLMIFADTAPTNMGVVWLGSLLTGVVSIGVGLIVGSLLPRQLEGTILLIGIVGVEMSIPMAAGIRHYMPFFGPQALFTAGRFSSDPIVLPHLLRSLGWSIGLGAAAVLLWTRHVRIHQWRDATQAAAPTGGHR